MFKDLFSLGLSLLEHLHPIQVIFVYIHCQNNHINYSSFSKQVFIYITLYSLYLKYPMSSIKCPQKRGQKAVFFHQFSPPLSPSNHYILWSSPTSFSFKPQYVIRIILSAVECSQSNFALLVFLDTPDMRRTSTYNSFHSL
jgi:hypothetical protein